MPGGRNLFFQLVSARNERGAMIQISNRGFARWGEVFDAPVAATPPVDRLLHHVSWRNEWASHPLCQHGDLAPDYMRSRPPITPPPASKRRGRPLLRRDPEVRHS
ncbi:ATP-binding protein [Methylobacterium sp. D54C]